MHLSEAGIFFHKIIINIQKVDILLDGQAKARYPKQIYENAQLFLWKLKNQCLYKQFHGHSNLTTTTE